MISKLGLKTYNEALGERMISNRTQELLSEYSNKLTKHDIHILDDHYEGAEILLALSDDNSISKIQIVGIGESVHHSILLGIMGILNATTLKKLGDLDLREVDNFLRDDNTTQVIRPTKSAKEWFTKSIELLSNSIFSSLFLKSGTTIDFWGELDLRQRIIKSKDLIERINASLGHHGIAAIELVAVEGSSIFIKAGSLKQKPAFLTGIVGAMQDYFHLSLSDSELKIIPQ